MAVAYSRSDNKGMARPQVSGVLPIPQKYPIKVMESFVGKRYTLRRKVASESKFLFPNSHRQKNIFPRPDRFGGGRVFRYSDGKSSSFPLIQRVPREHE
jgi:hypothetical protein